LFARSWTSDLKDRNIRVNAVSHGPSETPGLNRLVLEVKQRQYIEKLPQRSPWVGSAGLGRIEVTTEGWISANLRPPQFSSENSLAGQVYRTVTENSHSTTCLLVTISSFAATTPFRVR
jgi:NAD(P)-dependent dehydrogenase (short-subunit alcohol dehydrogenase family)